MDENSQREQELSEEHLRAISGGCGNCRWDKGVVTRHTERAAMYTRLSAIARHYELPDLAAEYSYTARVHSNAVREAQSRIDARHPQGDEPANKRQRLG